MREKHRHEHFSSGKTLFLNLLEEQGAADFADSLFAYDPSAHVT